MSRPSQNEAPHLTSFLVRSLVTLVIPKGYTLSITGSLAFSIRRYGFPGYVDAWGFAAGAVVAFVVLAIIGRSSLAEPLVELPISLLALANLVPLVVVPVVGAAVSA